VGRRHTKYTVTLANDLFLKNIVGQTRVGDGRKRLLKEKERKKRMREEKDWKTQ